MKLALVPLSLMLTVSGCSRADRAGRKAEPAPTPAPTPRFFDEKVRCATVGERWEKTICSEGPKANPMCRGWWAYNRERDTCVGVFITTTWAGKEKQEIMYVFDLLTAAELEPDCYRTGSTGFPGCDADSAKKRWITRQLNP